MTTITMIVMISSQVLYGCPANTVTNGLNEVGNDETSLEEKKPVVVVVSRRV
jgi:hypothetical protein